jgi:hypothetical protein
MGEVKIGEWYMVADGKGWMFVGVADRLCGMFGLVLRRGTVVNVCRTGAATWGELAAGKKRENATVRGMDGELILPLVDWALEAAPWTI